MTTGGEPHDRCTGTGDHRCDRSDRPADRRPHLGGSYLYHHDRCRLRHSGEGGLGGAEPAETHPVDAEAILGDGREQGHGHPGPFDHPHRGVEEQPAALLAMGSNGARVVLNGVEDGVAAGQACVFYSDGSAGARVLGGGWIARTLSPAELSSEEGGTPRVKGVDPKLLGTVTRTWGSAPRPVASTPPRR